MQAEFTKVDLNIANIQESILFFKSEQIQTCREIHNSFLSSVSGTEPEDFKYSAIKDSILQIPQILTRNFGDNGSSIWQRLMWPKDIVSSTTEAAITTVQMMNVYRFTSVHI
jgi:hypothetical protein